MSSSCRLREKNVALEAVIGVLGVFALALLGGGVRFASRSSKVAVSKALIFAAVGVLRGSRFSGGSRMGCNFFLLTCVVGFCNFGSSSGLKDDL